MNFLNFKTLKMRSIVKIMRDIKYGSRQSLLNSAYRLQNSQKDFHTCKNLCIKMFMEYENKYAYKVMETKGYTASLYIEKEEASLSDEQFKQFQQDGLSAKSTHRDLFNIFPKLGAYCKEHGLHISNKMFDDYIDKLTDSFQYASDIELKSIFNSLMNWPETESLRTRNYIEVWVALDDQCLKRIQRWSFDEMLSFVSLFYMLNVTKVSDFSMKCLQKLASKAKQLSPGEFIQTMFFIGVFRKSPFDIHNLEIYLENNFSKFSIDDLAIVSMGFFKSKTPIRDMEIISKIINKVIENSKDIHEVSLAALLKLIRYSMKITTDDSIYRMLNKLQHEVPRLSVMCNVHMALVGSTTLTFHEECLTKIADYIIGSISKTRIKDLERLVLTYGTFNFRPQTKECFFQKVIEELRKPERKVEIEKHGKSFACCVAYLGLMEIYPVDLMNVVLNPKFLERTYGKGYILYGREVLTIHNSAEIFCKEAKMNRLSNKVTNLLAKKYTDYMPDENYKKQYNITEQMILDIMRVLKNSRGGHDYVIGDHILTHHQRGDVIICNNHDGSPVPVTDTFRCKQFGELRQPPDNNQWIALVIGGRNTIIRNTGKPTGPILAKIRELKHLGFHASSVLWSIYSTLKTNQEKIDYLNSLIKQAVNK